jgi:hypothetical protein
MGTKNEGNKKKLLPVFTCNITNALLLIGGQVFPVGPRGNDILYEYFPVSQQLREAFSSVGRDKIIFLMDVRYQRACNFAAYIIEHKVLENLKGYGYIYQFMNKENFETTFLKHNLWIVDSEPRWYMPEDFKIIVEKMQNIESDKVNTGVMVIHITKDIEVFFV